MLGNWTPVTNMSYVHEFSAVSFLRLHATRACMQTLLLPWTSKEIFFISQR